MGIFDFMRGSDINAGIEAFQATQGAALLDVRTPEEYREGHVPQSINIPLQSLDSITLDEDTPLFVYCHSGARSSRAAQYLQSLGYTNVKNIGGISDYRGKVER